MSNQENFAAVEIVESDGNDSGHEGVPDDLPLPTAIKETIEEVTRAAIAPVIAENARLVRKMKFLVGRQVHYSQRENNWNNNHGNHFRGNHGRGNPRHFQLRQTQATQELPATKNVIILDKK